MADWPPTLDVLKADRGISLENVDKDVQYSQVLDAAVAYVERVRGEDFNFAANPLSELPAPTADLVLGTVRLAYRWHERRQSPDAVIDMGELGKSRIPSFDPDIDRLLGIGRFAPPRFA